MISLSVLCYEMSVLLGRGVDPLEPFNATFFLRMASFLVSLDTLIEDSLELVYGWDLLLSCKELSGFLYSLLTKS